MKELITDSFFLLKESDDKPDANKAQPMPIFFYHYFSMHYKNTTPPLPQANVKKADKKVARV
ncbi:hypothetical protein [Hahella sp. NBU794]|uniref:hypothetical protein n=1 Tax=Hahella sp. NBU794 TaxID=3422590 RepID=UPI003D6ED9EB